MTIDEMIAVLQAAKAGKRIEFRYKGGQSWFGFSAWSSWDFIGRDYRIKPEPREFWITKQGDVYIRAYDNKAEAEAWTGRELIKAREVL